MERKRWQTRLSAVLLTCLMVFTTPMNAMASGETGKQTTNPAADAEVTVTVGIAGALATDKDDKAMVSRTVTVKDTNGDGQLTYDEALAAAHGTYYVDGAEGYATTSESWGLSVTKLWGQSTVASYFYKNDISIPNAVDAESVKDGDCLTVGTYKDATGYSDAYAKFAEDEYQGKAGKALTVSLKKSYYGANYELVEDDCAEATLKAYDENYTELGSDAYAINGYQVTFNAAGTYYLVATGIDGERTLVPAGTKIVIADFDGVGTEKNPYLLSSVEDLVKLKDKVNNGNAMAGVYFKMTNDITLPADWTPMGKTIDGTNDIQKGANLYPFSGSFDGNGKTITVPEGGLPLLGYVKTAEVKNLNIYGKKIAGYGLVNNYVGLGFSGIGIIVDNVTLKSGSSTLESGLLGTYITTNDYAGSSATFVATISNCVIEKDVIIGYSKDKKMIGSIAGRMNGTIENCVSYATVYGTDYVGGILGTRDNSMGTCAVSNCDFAGKVVATGELAGGIVGGGYDGDFASNGCRIPIIDCTVVGSVTGKNKIGGIIGGDTKVVAVLEKDAYELKGNSFTGKVKAIEGPYVGGIIGYYNSLNKYDGVIDNYYSPDCGVEKGIGYVQYINTSCMTHETSSGATYFNTENNTDGCPDVGYCTWEIQSNRTDDPLGVDADTLATNKERIVVKFQLLGDSVHGANGEEHTLMHGGLKTWVPNKTYRLDTNATVYDLLKEVENNTEGLKINSNYNDVYGSEYVSSVEYDGVRLAERDNGENAGWLCNINGKQIEVGISKQRVNNGDEIIFYYTDNYMMEKNVNYDQEQVDSVIEGVNSIPSLDKLIKDDAGLVKRVRKAYENLTDVQKKLFPAEMLAKLEAAEARIKELMEAEENHVHTFGVWTKVKNATISTAEKHQRVCSVCHYVETRDGAKAKATIKVTASTITLKTKQKTNKFKVTGLAKGDAVKQYKSSNKKIFNVTKKGVITAGKKAGKATLTITLKSGLKKRVIVKVQKKAVASTKITGLKSKVSLKKGKKLTLKPTVKPFTCVQKVTYTSSKKGVASVSSKGTIKALKAGKTKITVKCGKCRFVVNVTVTKK